MLVLLALLAPASALSIEETRPAWTLQVDPLTTALGYVHLQVERRVAPGWSVYAGPHLRLFDGILTESPEPYTGLGLEAGVRWFPRARAPEGPWVLLRGVGARLSSAETTPATGFGGYASALGGATWVIDDWLVLSGGLGVQRLFYTLGPYGTEGWLPAAHTAVGVAF